MYVCVCAYCVGSQLDTAGVSWGNAPIRWACRQTYEASSWLMPTTGGTIPGKHNKGSWMWLKRASQCSSMAPVPVPAWSSCPWVPSQCTIRSQMRAGFSSQDAFGHAHSNIRVNLPSWVYTHNVHAWGWQGPGAKGCWTLELEFPWHALYIHKHKEKEMWKHKNRNKTYA